MVSCRSGRVDGYTIKVTYLLPILAVSWRSALKRSESQCPACRTDRPAWLRKANGKPTTCSWSGATDRTRSSPATLPP